MQNYTKVRIPSRCHKISCGNLDDSDTGRVFLNNINKIEIPETVTEIGSYAFGGTFGNALNSIENIDIPNSVTSIGGSAFSGCSSLTNTTIPDSVESIDFGTFIACTNLTNMTILDNVINIGEYTFYGCSSLTNIDFNGTTKEWNNIIKNSGWNNNSSIQTITCTDGVITL